MKLRLKLPQLTIEGRRRFGEFVANALLGAAAAIGLAIILPTWAGAAVISPLAVGAGALMLFLCSTGSVAVRYFTEERIDEGEGWPR